MNIDEDHELMTVLEEVNIVKKIETIFENQDKISASFKTEIFLIAKFAEVIAEKQLRNEIKKIVNTIDAKLSNVLKSKQFQIL